jgi:hypothetical protein
MFIFLPPTEILEILDIFCTIGYWVLTIGIGYWVFKNRLLVLGIGFSDFDYCYWVLGSIHYWVLLHVYPIPNSQNPIAKKNP